MNGHAVAIYLSPHPGECRVLLDGRDISDCCCGVDVHAYVGGDARTTVVLQLFASVEIIGEPGDLRIEKPSGEP